MLYNEVSRYCIKMTKKLLKTDLKKGNGVGMVQRPFVIALMPYTLE